MTPNILDGSVEMVPNYGKWVQRIGKILLAVSVVMEASHSINELRKEADYV
jgi:hypothetical protein